MNVLGLYVDLDFLLVLGHLHLIQFLEASHWTDHEMVLFWTHNVIANVSGILKIDILIFLLKYDISEWTNELFIVFRVMVHK